MREAGRLRRLSYKLIVIFIVPVVMLAAFMLMPGNLQAQQPNGVTAPAPGEVVSGIVVVSGSANNPDFLRYELAFQPAFSPSSDWIVFAQGDRPVISDTLTIWDTTVGGEFSPVFPDGRYQLRLRVVRNDYNYDEYLVSDLVVANIDVTPTVTPTITPTIGVALATPLPGTALAATMQASVGELSTLTPFPTPTRIAAAIDAPLGPGGNAEGEDLNSEENQGLLAQIQGIETSIFGRSFWFGVQLVAIAFIGLAFYLILRAIVRWLRRKLGPKKG
jgi:hypothetical protein